MSSKPVVPRERARRDVEEALDHYLAEAGERTPQGFVAALAGEKVEGGSCADFLSIWA